MTFDFQAQPMGLSPLSQQSDGLDPYITQAQQQYKRLGGKYTGAQVIALAQDLQKQDTPVGPTALEKVASGKRSSALNVVDEFEKEYFSLVKPGKNQVMARVGGPFKELGGTLGMNDVRVYKDHQLAFVAPIIRALGDTGALSDKDRIAAVKALPRIDDSEHEAQLKFAFLKKILQKGSVAGQTQPQMGSQGLSAPVQQQGVTSFGF